MGNSIASKAGSSVTIMQLDGETFKMKAPVTVEQVVRDYPNHVVLDSDAVRHLGTKAKPLDSSTQLRPKHLYFLLVLPEINDPRVPNRVRSDITMTAKSRLEAMLLARRSSSDITVPTSAPQWSSSSQSGEAQGRMRVKVRMTKAQLAQLTAESNNSSETAEKILDFYLNDGEAQKNLSATEHITEKPLPVNMSDPCERAPRNRVRFSPDVQQVEAY